MEIIMRKAQLSDLEILTDIYNQAIKKGNCTCDTETFTKEQRLPWLESHNDEKYPLYTCVCEGKPVGYAYFTAYRPGRKAVEDVAEISYYLDFSYHSKGIGSQIMEFMLKKAKELELNTLIAILLGNNEKSVGILKKYGFELWGTMPNIVHINGESINHVYYGLKSK